MKKKLKYGSILLTIFMISVIVAPISAADIPGEFTKLNEKELADIQGMGQNFSIQDVNSSDIKFSYSGNKGNAFKHASGVMNVTNVSGNGNTIKNIVDLKINIYNIDEVESLDLSDIKDFIDVEDLE